MNYIKFTSDFFDVYDEYKQKNNSIYIKDFMSFLSKKIKKQKKEEMKDESEFFNGDSEINPDQYDFNYRQRWAIEESGKAYNSY